MEMRKVRTSHGKLTALAVLAIAAILSVIPIRSTRSAAPLDEPNLSNEERTVNSFTDDLSNFDTKRAELSKKPSLTNEEFSSLERTGNDLKRRVSQLKDATESIINKLKAAGRWNTLDEDVLARLTDAKDRATLRDNGGLRHILESAVTDLNGQSGDEIVAPLSQLRSKVAQSKDDRFDWYQEVPSRMVAASYELPTYGQPAPLMIRSLRCIGATIRLAVSGVLHGPGTGPGPSYNTIPKDTMQKFQCNCYPQSCPGNLTQ